MAKQELVRALAEEMGISESEAEEFLERAARARERKNAALAKRGSDEIDFPSGPTGGSRAITRGVEMYGEETAAEAYERWMDQEMDDPEGVYGPGGGTAGGIFGDGPIAMANYDGAAHRRTEGRMGGMAQIRMLEVLEKISRRLDAAEARERGQLTGASEAPRLPGRRRGR